MANNLSISHIFFFFFNLKCLLFFFFFSTNSLEIEIQLFFSISDFKLAYLFPLFLWHNKVNPPPPIPISIRFLGVRTRSHALVIPIFQQSWKWRTLRCEGSPLWLFFLSFWAYSGTRNAYPHGKTNNSVRCKDQDRQDAKTACCICLHALNSTEIRNMNNECFINIIIIIVIIIVIKWFRD